jgi:hypothetical protein
MPQVRAERLIRLDPETVFAFSQTTGAFRLTWDPFISAQGWLDGATAAGKGVRTRTVSRMGLVMVSEYVSYAPPRNVGMTMVSGPWFLPVLAAAGGSHRTTAAPGPSGSTPSPAARHGCGRLPRGSAPGCWAKRSTSGSKHSRAPARTPGSWRSSVPLPQGTRRRTSVLRAKVHG